MDQLKNTTVRFGITDPADFSPAGSSGDWRRIDVAFPSPFGPPKPGFPKGVPQEVSVVVTALDMRVAPVAVVKNVTNAGFVLWARNAMNNAGSARFAWLAVLGVPDQARREAVDVRLGVLQTKEIVPFKAAEWPGIRYEERGPAVSESSKLARAAKMIRELRSVGYRVELLSHTAMA